MGKVDVKSTMTLLVNIPEVAGSAGRPSTALFFPSSLKRDSVYNLLLYLHGKELPPVDEWLIAKPDRTVPNKADWKPDPRFTLREKVEESGKNLVLVVPSLDVACKAGKLATHPDWYVDRVLEEIGKTDGGKTATLGKLVIAAHSGGGLRMYEAVTALSTYKPNLVECWGFDCLYWYDDPKPWKPKAGAAPPNPHPLEGSLEYRWATSGIRIRVHYLSDPKTGSTIIRSENLATLSSEIPGCKAEVYKTTQPHNLIPREHMRERLDALPF